MKLNFAIIGLGPHGKRLFESANRIPEIQVIALVDREPGRLHDSIYNAVPHKLNDLQQLWKLPDTVHGLLIATNGPSHAPIALEAMDKGMTHLLISKPMACSVFDAHQIANAAHAKNVRIVVDHGLRYDATYNWILTTLNSGEWGKLKTVYVHRPGIGLGCLGVHSFDLANYLMQETPAFVTGWVDEPKGKNPRGEQFTDPGGLVVLNYSDEKKAIISQVEAGAGPMLVELVTEFARIRIDEKYGELEVITKDKNFVPGPGKPVPLQKVMNPHQQQVSHDIFNLMELAILDLIGHTEIKANAAVGLNSVSILAAAYLSHANGHSPYALPLTQVSDLELFLPVT